MQEVSEDLNTCWREIMYLCLIAFGIINQNRLFYLWAYPHTHTFSHAPDIYILFINIFQSSPLYSSHCSVMWSDLWFGWCWLALWLFASLEPFFCGRKGGIVVFFSARKIRVANWITRKIIEGSRWCAGATIHHSFPLQCTTVGFMIAY